MSGGGGSQTTTQQIQLPDWLNNASQYALNNAQTLAATPYTPNPYAVVAPFRPDQVQAQDQIRALQGTADPAYDAAEGAITGGGLLNNVATITPDQLNQTTAQLFNPYTLATVAPTVTQMRQALGQSLAVTGANASGVGAFGGSRQGIQEGTAQAQEALGEGQLVGGLLSSGYNTAQAAASGLLNSNLQAGEWATNELPTLATNQTTLNDQQTELLSQSGATQQQMQQALWDTAATNQQAQINWPFEMQDVLENALSSVPYPSTTTTTGPKASGNKAAGALGGAAAGASIGSVVPGYGTAIGAVAGGLLGFLGS